MQRVMILGQPGAGKSTLALAMGEITGLPVVHIDHIHWESGWKERSRSEKTRLCAEVHARDRWIFEGGHSVTWPERLDRCDSLIWLDIPFTLRIRRVMLRSFRYWGRTRPDLPTGCPEQFSWEFYRWIWNTRKSGRSNIEAFVDTAPGTKAIYILRTLAETDVFLAKLRREHPAPARLPPPDPKARVAGPPR
ncbi:AAA family ATPase [Paracoccus alkanivorans]|uniref:AAA family ATPase n=1 Tax=Paracoccus alkanivorans TaxID=2116655 RepID=UPI001FB8048A|nr:AAA family ATPase [Paracoccus alkanivorans]